MVGKQNRNTTRHLFDQHGHSVLSTEQDLETIKWEILVLIGQNMKIINVSEKMCAIYISRAIIDTKCRYTFYWSRISCNSNVMSLYITWHKTTSNETIKYFDMYVPAMGGPSVIGIATMPYKVPTALAIICRPTMS